MSESELLENDFYQKEYDKDFVDHWDDLIGWEGRQEAEAGFFHRMLDAFDLKKVLDAACGTGFHSITMAQEGFQVTAADGAGTMVEKTLENARQLGVQLSDSRAVDWLNLEDEFGENAFDALICLGNAFTHLFEHETRRDALRQMYRVVRPGGMIIVDHRNYDSLLEEGFNSKHQYYYTGEGIDARPIELTRTLAKFQYTFPNGNVFYLHMYPLKQDYVTHLLQDAGFADVNRYGDFERPYQHYEPDFIQQVALKPKR